jgi:hypothetical protein
MSTINNQTKGLFALDAVEDLSHDSAAAIQGGIVIWDGYFFNGSNVDIPSSSDLRRHGYNDKISSISNNTKKFWAFYTDPNFKGRFFLLEPGQSISALGSFNNQISSMRSI